MANAKETRKILLACLEADVVPIIWGFHGIGKTDVVDQIAEEYGGELIKIHLANHSDPGDLIGLPNLKKMQEEERTSFALPEMWPTSGKGVIHLDELNRAQPPVIQAMYPFILDRTIGSYRLPEGWRIIVSCNPPGTDYIVTPMDAAKLTRFCHIPFKPTVDEWLEWARANKIRPSIIGFVQMHGEEALFGADIIDRKVQDYIQTHPKPRTQAILSRVHDALEKLGTLDVLEVAAVGCLGPEMAAAYLKFIDADTEKPLTGQEVLNSYPNCVLTIDAWTNNAVTKISLLRKTAENVTAELLRRYIENKYNVNRDEVETYASFLKQLPLEIVSATLGSDLTDTMHQHAVRMTREEQEEIEYNMHQLTVAVYSHKSVMELNKKIRVVEESNDPVSPAVAKQNRMLDMIRDEQEGLF